MKRRATSGIIAGVLCAVVLGVILISPQAGETVSDIVQRVPNPVVPTAGINNATGQKVYADEEKRSSDVVQRVPNTVASTAEKNNETGKQVSASEEKQSSENAETNPAVANSSTLRNGKTDKHEIADSPTAVDYREIVDEISDEKYRENVEVADNVFCVVRAETADSVAIEDEAWYKQAQASHVERIATREGQEAGSSIVSYRITTAADDVWAVIDATNDTGEVEIAEPDYVFTASEDNSSSTTDIASNSQSPLASAFSTQNFSGNPNIDKQWYLTDQKALDIWNNPVTYGDTSGEGSVVAVIDTGIDYTHEDLLENMWLNAAEVNGDEGIDDDHNGYVDDIYGINLIDLAATPQDDHGHGTHVAGIIAMANNGIGGVGLAYNSKVMAIKAGGSDGSFNSSDIARAVTYAYKNGADVINMSFGSPAHSAVVESALQDAFNSCVLVASAGNDSKPTRDAIGGYNCYPAAYSYVIGVMSYASDESFSYFSNFDYRPNYGAEYEIAAPGSSIFSTLPGNRYASWNGTSMAAPMVAATAAILRSSHPDKSTYSSRYIMGQIVSATEKTVTLMNDYGVFTYSKLCLEDSLLKSAKPNINIDEIYIFDSPSISDMNNGDGIVQPGETIDFGVGLRNQWGAATNVNLTIDASSTGGVANPYVEYVSGQEVPIDDIGTFGTQNNGFIFDDTDAVIGVSKPVRVKIADNAPNDLNINFLLNYTAKNALDANDATVYTQMRPTQYVVNVVKGTLLEGRITEDVTWTKDNYYIVKNSVLIPRGVTVTVEPGTQIQFWTTDESSVYGDTYMPFIQVQGKLNVNGTEAEPVEMFPGKDFENYQVELVQEGDGSINLSYVNILNPYVTFDTGDHLSFKQDYDQSMYRYYDTYTSSTYASSRGSLIDARKKLSNSRIKDLRGTSLWDFASVGGKFDTCLFDDCQISYENIEAVNCVFLNNQGRYEDPYSGTLQYFSSKMNNVGDRYREPQFTTVTDVHVADGKKYVAYHFDNYFFDSSVWDSATGAWINMGPDNYDAIEKALEAKGGRLAVLDIDNNEDDRAVLVGMYEELNKASGENYQYLLAGYHYNVDEGKLVATDGSTIPSNWYLGNFSKSNLFMYYSMYAYQESYWDEESQTYKTRDAVSAYNNQGWNNIDSSQSHFVIAEYPESIDDYTVKNPVFNLNSIGLESTKFTNNAILNRLTSTNTYDWMRVATSDGNTYAYICAGNYWGTTNQTIISKQVTDFDANIRLADIVTAPELSAPAESMYPCVSNAYVTDKNGDRVTTIGNGEYTVHVQFNRDMDTSVDPMVTYGPDDPYSDYSFTGGWVSAREWVGTTSVKILINQGKQYLRVKDAVAADDAWLTTGTDWARFTFQVEGTGAEALTLQGEGVKGGVYLSWTQDEYDTMAGFNVYRSESGAEGTFNKVNPSIISPDAREFVDSKATSGKQYYYYFTIVDTDMAESRPSNIVRCASLDDQVPVVKHTKSSSLTYGVPAAIVATITDNVGVNVARLHYRMAGEEVYKQVAMVNTSDATYSAQIPARDLAVGTLEYYIGAADSVDWGYAGSPEEPFSVSVETKVAVTSVAVDDVEVGSQAVGVVRGMNFTDNLSVRVEGKAVETTFISDTELSFTCVPTYMGKKKVEIADETGNRIASFANAFTATDNTIEVYGTEDVVIKESTDWQNIYLNSNYTGKVETLQIVSEYPVYFEGQMEVYPALSWSNSVNNDFYDGATRIYDHTFKMPSNTMANGGQLLYLQVYNIKSDSLPRLLSVKINGVEVTNLNADFSQATLIDQNAYIPVEEIEVEDNSYTLDVGQSFTPEFVLSPNNATRRNAVSYDYDTNYLRKNTDGTFTVLRSGGSYLYVNCDGKRGEIYVYGNPIPISSITAEKAAYSGVVGNTITINWAAEPLESDVFLGYNSWDSSYIEEVSSTNNGRTRVFRLKKAGEISLGIGAYNDATAEVVWCYVPVSILANTAYTEIDEDIIGLYPNQQFAPTVRVRNLADGEEGMITWTTSNASVAMVSSDGVVSAVGKGYATITASVENGAKSDSIIILVGSDNMSYVVGDVNMDGVVSAIDSMLALKLSQVDAVNPAIKAIADVNQDNSISATDAMLILQYVTGAIKEF